MERALPPHSFFRCHRSHVINLALVQQLVVHGGYRVYLTAGHTVEVARRRLAALKEALARV
ncbi:MAG TPA: LytTR family DNA-binding domain-containing protein [Flavobacteriales bacterium]|nr:LytTR family DNA-binding domain-containing protein [Flavobacteriales bacterium]